MSKLSEKPYWQRCIILTCLLLGLCGVCGLIAQNFTPVMISMLMIGVVGIAVWKASDAKEAEEQREAARKAAIAKAAAEEERAAARKPIITKAASEEERATARKAAKPKRATEEEKVAQRKAAIAKAAAEDNAIVNGAYGAYSGRSFCDDYHFCIKTMLKNGSTIHALMKTEDVDSYTLVNSGGPFKKYLETTLKTGAEKDTAPSSESRGIRIVNHPSLTKEVIDEWCETSDGEGDKRYIWYTGQSGFTWCKQLARVQYETISRFYGEPYNDYIKEHSFYACLRVRSERHDLIHDPWHPVYPDLKGFTLQDLRIGSGEAGQTVSIYSESERKKLAEEFFSSGNILSDRGMTLTESEKVAAFGRMLEFVQKWRVSKAYETNCKAGHFYCCYGYYEVETTCLDGGNYSPDTVTRSRSVSFELYNEDPDCWEQLVEKTEKLYPNFEREDTLARWERSWGYNGHLVDDATDIVNGGGYLYLRNPFGLRGVFSFSQ